MRILFCGLSGIPNKASASINRYLALGQVMSETNEIIFINRFPLYRKQDAYPIKNSSFRIIDATNIQYRPSSFVKRNFIKLTSFIHEYKTIRRINKERKIDWLNIYTQYFGIFIIYYLFSKIFKFKTILHYVELRSKFNSRSFLYRLNDLLFDKVAILLCDKIIPISTILNEYLLTARPNVKTLIIPPICDFKYFSSIIPENYNNKEYFIFCSSNSYEEVIKFTIKSFLKMKNNQDITLHLVINGQIGDDSILQLIKENSEKIILFSNLKYEDLISKYKGSLAAIVPLRNSLQDSARFPQKICEFLASNIPIITTSFGEINNYFKDGINAVIATEFNVEIFTKKLDWAISHKEELKIISANSYLTGLKHFDIKSYSFKLDNFIKLN